MAITGDGKTLDTAYLVHDYWELKSVCTYDYTGNTDDIKYVKLANDIDCNADAYSNDFEWEAIPLYNRYGSTSSDHQVIDLNLNNKSIKNVMIANDSRLFVGYGSDTNMTTIHDGKILNIFCNNSKQIINAYSESNYVKIKNVSMSVEGTSAKNTAFYRCYMDCCSLYYKSAKLNNDIFSVAGTYQYKNCDFKFDILDCNGKFIYNEINQTNTVWDSCRFSGIAKGDFPTEYNGSQFRQAKNCVFDIDIYTRDYGSAYYITTNCTGIFNISKSHLGRYVRTGLTDVTSTEIKSATELAKKGFVVTNISPSTTT